MSPTGAPVQSSLSDVAARLGARVTGGHVPDAAGPGPADATPAADAELLESHFAELGGFGSGVEYPTGEMTDPLLVGVTHDSGYVRPGFLFAALTGSRYHGTAFLPDALIRGAVAVLTDEAGRDAAEGSGLPTIVVPDPRAVLGEVAAQVYGRPADDLLVLAVTGTNGKTTTAHLLHAGLQVDDESAGLVGTVETRIGPDVAPSVRTTPEATDLHALLAQVVDRGGRSVVMEASSIAVSMGRVSGLRFDVVGFTNLSQDHLDFHGDMESYYRAKAELFTPKHSRRGVVVVDDEAGRRLADEAQVPVTTVAIDSPADWTAVELEPQVAGGTTFRARGPDGTTVPARAPIPGRFNVANALLAIVMLVEAGFEPAAAAAGVAACPGVPGRMEPVDAGQPFLAVVDYAHTPGAVSRLLTDLRPSVAPGSRMLTVLGCGGDRDRAKRPMMGAAAARGSDVLVVTDDNPRSEDPEVIRAAMVAGTETVPADERAEVHVVGDRAAAIRTAVELAGPGDVVLVAGKGHEQGQESAGGVITPFDDRAVLAAALLERADR